MPVTLCVARRPKSINSSPSPGYRNAIFNAAQQKHSGPLFEGPLYSRIVWFHKHTSNQGDIDNISKRIHDALKGALFADDRSITHTLAIRVDATNGYEIEGDFENPDAAYELLQHLDAPESPDVLYIEIGAQQAAKIRLGPVS